MYSVCNVHIRCHITRSIIGRPHETLKEHASAYHGLSAGLSNSRADAWKNYHDGMLTGTPVTFDNFLVLADTAIVPFLG